MVALGFIVVVALIGVPWQPFAVGVIVKVTVTAALVRLAKVPLIFPEPLAGIPVTISVLFLVHVKVVFGTGPPKLMVLMASSVHLDCDNGVAVTVGIGFTVTVAFIEVPVQPFAEIGVMV
jgi:hypothetical protein